MSGAATLPSQQAPGGGEERVTCLHKPVPNLELIRPPRAVYELAAEWNCITRRISRTLPSGADLACMELTRGSARGPDPLNFPYPLVAFLRCSAACSTTMATWTKTTISVRMQWYSLVWCGADGMLLATCMSEPRAAQDGLQTHFRRTQRLELPEKLLVVGVHLHAHMRVHLPNCLHVSAHTCSAT